MKIYALESLASFYCKLNVMRLVSQLYDFALAFAFAFAGLVCDCKAYLSVLTLIFEMPRHIIKIWSTF